MAGRSKDKRPTVSDVPGRGAARRSAGIAVRRERAINKQSAAIQKAFDASIGRKRDNQSTDSNNR